MEIEHIERNEGRAKVTEAAVNRKLVLRSRGSRPWKLTIFRPYMVGKGINPNCRGQSVNKKEEKKSKKLLKFNPEEGYTWKESKKEWIFLGNGPGGEAVCETEGPERKR